MGTPLRTRIGGRHRGFIAVQGRGLFDRFTYELVSGADARVSARLQDEWYGSLGGCVFPLPLILPEVAVEAEGELLKPWGTFTCPSCGFIAPTMTDLITHVERDAEFCSRQYPHYHCYGKFDIRDAGVLDSLGKALADAENAATGHNFPYELLMADSARFSKKTAFAAPTNVHYGIYFRLVEAEGEPNLEVVMLPRPRVIEIARAQGFEVSEADVARLLDAPSTLILLCAHLVTTSTGADGEVSTKIELSLGTIFREVLAMAVEGNSTPEAHECLINSVVDYKPAAAMEPGEDVSPLDILKANEVPKSVEDSQAYRQFVDYERRRDALVRQFLETKSVKVLTDVPATVYE
jgi:hypothetical protein